MILRKPYAFLIKYFKIIHLILTGCAIYLVTRVNGMLKYFNNFIDGTVGKLGAADYFGNMYVYITILVIVICLIIIMLMRYKKKSYFFYIILIGYFLATSLIISSSIEGLYKIYISSLDIKTLLLYRDILRILSIVQYVFVAMVLVRGLGFDIKKFNFVEDLVELNISVDDDEEVELTVGSLEGAKRKFNRNIREFKYYYLENKLMINMILVVMLFVCLSGYFVNKMFLNPIYKVNDSFDFDSFSFKVLDSYVTNIGYNKVKVGSDNNTFVLIKINISNEGISKEVNTANFILEIGNYTYSEGVLTSKFIDLGTVYKGAKIEGSSTYLFVFEIPVEKSKENMTLVIGNEKKVNLSPVYLDIVEKADNYKLSDTVDMSNSFYKMGSLKIKSYEFAETFNYKYTYEVLDKKYDGNITISSNSNVIMNLVMEGIYPSGFNNYSFLEKYAKLKYIVNGVEYTSDVFGDKTPDSYKDGLYLVVDKEIKDADSVWFDIVIRNKRYIYKLK